MFDATRPVRTRAGLRAEIVINQPTYKDSGHQNPPIMALVWGKYNKFPHIKFYDSFGRSTGSVVDDLVNCDTDKAAIHVQTVIKYPVYSALKDLWKAGHQEAVVDIACEGSGIPAMDMRYYLKGLWGDGC